MLPSSSLAAEPISLEDLENPRKSITAFQLRKEAVLRDKPIKVLRRTMEQKFAVQLMRQSYAVFDNMDICAMDQFQRDFFLIRSTYYEDYVKSLGGRVTQGQLTGTCAQGATSSLPWPWTSHCSLRPALLHRSALADPNYFDYISFSQYRTFNYELVKPAKVFVEQQAILPDDPDYDPSSGEITKFRSTAIQRPADLMDDQMLPLVHSERVGRSILKFFDETFGNNSVSARRFRAGDVAAMTSNVQKLLDLFLICGYALEGRVTMAASNDKMMILEMTSPATLWSEKALKDFPLSNSFVLKTTAAYLADNDVRIKSTKKVYANDKVTYEINFLT